MNLFRQLEDLDISVRFVRGNHDQRVKDRISSIHSLVNVDRLDQSTNWGSLGGFNIIGQGSDNFNEVSDFNWSGFESKYGGPNILIAHPKNIERDESVFEKLLKRIEKRWIVFFGHQHEEGRFDTERLRAIFTGFPAKTDDTGSVWRVRGGNEYCRVTRHSLRNWTELY
jgi:predicted phosphodiesterase